MNPVLQHMKGNNSNSCSDVFSGLYFTGNQQQQKLCVVWLGNVVLIPLYQSRCLIDSRVHLSITQRAYMPKCVICNLITPSFNVEGKPAKYCRNCKTQEMVRSYKQGTMCTVCNSKVSHFNYPGLKPKYCSACATERMVNVHLKNKCKICQSKEARYNVPGQKPQFCRGCKSETMINTKDKKCLTCRLKSPSFNVPGSCPRYCKSCKLEGMVNVVEEKREMKKMKNKQINSNSSDDGVEQTKQLVKQLKGTIRKLKIQNRDLTRRNTMLELENNDLASRIAEGGGSAEIIVQKRKRRKVSKRSKAPRKTAVDEPPARKANLVSAFV